MGKIGDQIWVTVFNFGILKNGPKKGDIWSKKAKIGYFPIPNPDFFTIPGFGIGIESLDPGISIPICKHYYK